MLYAVALLAGSWLAFLGYRWTPIILTVIAVGELVSDQLPSTPSRTVPVQFATRVLVGAVCGAALAMPANWVIGAGLGAVGGVIGTLGGASARGGLAARFGADRPAALLEDLIAIAGAALIVMLA